MNLDELHTLDRGLAGFGYNRIRPLSIHDRDYLDATSDPIVTKLSRCLQQHNIEANFQRVTLITAPRYLHYAFNPVSFYLCYGPNDRLDCFVMEVNNTFQERHVYVLDQFHRDDNVWRSVRTEPKQFHVSPFNNMHGDYDVSILDNEHEFDIRIDLVRDGRCVLQTQLRGDKRPLTTGAVLNTIVRFPIRPLLTFPRILWEAARLAYEKRLRVYHKPIPIHPTTRSTRSPTLAQRLAMRIVFRLFNNLRHGGLQVVLPNGLPKRFGAPNAVHHGAMHIRDYRFFTRLLARGSIGFGEAYVDGFWQSENPAEVLTVLAHNLSTVNNSDGWLFRLRQRADSRLHAKRNNTRSNSRKNIHEHYDLGNDFYQTFLDPTMTYSAGMFLQPDDSLEQAQLHKLDAMIRKADIHPEHHILEIGSGWGSFAIRAAQTTGCRVTSITLSEEQHRFATERVKEAGLQDRVDIRICDYRDMEGSFDRIVSIEMLEAVGHEFLGAYFDRCRRLLKPDGCLVVQVITIPDERYESYRTGCDWIQKYIFPGGHLPSPQALSDIMAQTNTFEIESSDDIASDYAQTLHLWRQQFTTNLDRVRQLGYDDTFIRKWMYYLSYCEAGFRAKAIHTHQYVLAPMNLTHVEAASAIQRSVLATKDRSKVL